MLPFNEQFHTFCKDLSLKRTVLHFWQASLRISSRICKHFDIWRNLSIIVQSL